MLAILRTVDLALDIYTWIIIASAVFSWLYAFNVVNSATALSPRSASFFTR